MSGKREGRPHPFALRSVYIRDSEIKFANDFDPLIPGQEINGQFRSNFIERILRKGNNEQSFHLFLIQFEFRYSKVLLTELVENSGILDPGYYASVRTTIAVDYVAPTNVEPTEEQIVHWGNTSALIHAWPYWREYLHSSLLRMSLPPVVMPIIDIQNGQKEEKPKSKGRVVAGAAKSSNAKRSRTI